MIEINNVLIKREVAFALPFLFYNSMYVVTTGKGSKAFSFAWIEGKEIKERKKEKRMANFSSYAFASI